MYVRFVGAYTDAVYIYGVKHMFKLIESLRAGTAVLISERSAGSIDEDNFAGLSVLKFDKSGTW